MRKSFKDLLQDIFDICRLKIRCMHLTHSSRQSGSEAIDFILRYPLATLITSYHNRPFATQLPFLVETKNDSIVLVSYLDKTNKQWKHLEFEETLAIFQAPPTAIWKDDKGKKGEQTKIAVKSLQVFGNCNIVNGKDAANNLFKEVVEQFDVDLCANWLCATEGEQESILDNVVIFEMKVDDFRMIHTEIAAKSLEESHSN